MRPAARIDVVMISQFRAVGLIAYVLYAFQFVKLMFACLYLVYTHTHTPPQRETKSSGQVRMVTSGPS